MGPTEYARALAMLTEALQHSPSMLEPLTAADMRAAATTFKQRTVSPDGWHPRTFMLLSDESLTVLADLMNIFERQGMWATANSSVHTGCCGRKMEQID